MGGSENVQKPAYVIFEWSLRIDLSGIDQINIWLLNNNWINVKYHQMAFQSQSDGVPISPNQPSFGIPVQTKVSGDHQRESGDIP